MRLATPSKASHKINKPYSKLLITWPPGSHPCHSLHPCRILLPSSSRSRPSTKARQKNWKTSSRLSRMVSKCNAPLSPQTKSESTTWSPILAKERHGHGSQECVKQLLISSLTSPRLCQPSRSTSVTAMPLLPPSAA